MIKTIKKIICKFKGCNGGIVEVVIDDDSLKSCPDNKSSSKDINVRCIRCDEEYNIVINFEVS